MENYKDYDATGLATLVAKREVSADELLDAALARTAEVNDRLNAVVNMQPKAARAMIKAGLPEGPLTGVPFLIKDLGCEAVDFPSHNGSNLFRNTKYGVNSSLYTRLRGAGLVTFGRTASPEVGIGPITDAAAYGGATRNPWHTDHTPGGSSGGSGAAVAAGIVPAAHGSDGGGSVRIPASNCGLFGMKPTRGRLPDGPGRGEGWAGMAISGFLTHSVRDNALLLDICAGSDLGAPYVAPPLEKSFMAALESAPKALRIAVCETNLIGEKIDPECAQAVLEAAKLLEDMGHILTPARPKADTSGMMRAWVDIVACGTALSIRNKIEARGKPLQDGEIENIARDALRHAGTVSGEKYLEAVSRVHAYGREMAAFFVDYDILLTATMAEPPARIGRFSHTATDYVAYRTAPDGVFTYSPFAAAFNASGQPAASVPLHMSKSGLPIGVHIAAAFGADELVVSLAADLERAAPWARRRATL